MSTNLIGIHGQPLDPSLRAVDILMVHTFTNTVMITGALLFWIMVSLVAGASLTAYFAAWATVVSSVLISALVLAAYATLVECQTIKKFSE